MIVLIGGHRESVLELNNSCWFIVVCCWITMDVKDYIIRCVVVLGTHDRVTTQRYCIRDLWWDNPHKDIKGL